jgi:alpha-ketoglutarate-dependent taurine dioxygenase
MKLISLGPKFAAELRGVDLIDVATSEPAYRAVREAFEEHSVILFRNQGISDDAQVAFSRAFGPLERTKVGSLCAGTLYVHITNVATDATLVAETDRQALANRANQLWHTDSSFKATPALASVLSARTIPAGRRSSFRPGLHGTGCQTPFIAREGLLVRSCARRQSGFRWHAPSARSTPALACRCP